MVAGSGVVGGMLAIGALPFALDSCLPTTRHRALAFCDTSPTLSQRPGRRHLAALVATVALINAANRMAVLVHQKGGSYEVGMFGNMTANLTN